MTDGESMEIGIFILPSTPNQPPRAAFLDQEENVQQMATWSMDTGQWMVEGKALPQEFCEAISAHAAELGVPGFTADE